MGKGIDAARANAPLHAAVMDDFKDQLLIVMLRRLLTHTGKEAIAIPLAEVDDTGGLVLAFRVDEDKTFHFELRRKQ
jgi:hypothetical protein